MDHSENRALHSESSNSPDANLAHYEPQAIVVVPIKDFSAAKQRLSPTLNSDQRSSLARAMAEAVLAAAKPLGVVVACDSQAVADWARERGAAVSWTPGTDLNGSLTMTLQKVASAGVSRAVIAHADLPFATDLARFADLGSSEVVIVSDRVGDGTNVMSLPTPAGFPLRYGQGSCAKHREAAQNAGLSVVLVDDERLGWDIDGPDDLNPPATLGRLPQV